MQLLGQQVLNTIGVMCTVKKAALSGPWSACALELTFEVMRTPRFEAEASGGEEGKLLQATRKRGL